MDRLKAGVSGGELRRIESRLGDVFRCSERAERPRGPRWGRRGGLGSRRACLGRIGRAYVQFAVEYEGYFRVMFSRTLTGLHEFARIAEIRDATFLTLVASLAEAQGKDPSLVSVKSGESNPNVLRSWAVVHGLSYLWLDRNLHMSREQFESMLRDLFSHR